MKEYAYSAATNAFYPVALKSDYVMASSWPEDALEVDSSVYHEFAIGEPPEGKIRIAGDDGLPAWGDKPTPSKNVVLLQRSQTLKQLIQVAVAQISILQAGIDCGRSLDGDADALTAWQGYLCDLRELTDAQLSAPDFVFPSAPQ